MLPHPDHWDRYDADTRERIMCMAEAPTSDESKRRDRLVEAEIKESPKDRRAALLVVGGSMVGALIALGAFDSAVVAVAFLALPVMKVASDMISARRAPTQQKDGD